MSAQTHTYAADDPETALKYAIQHIRGDDRVQIVEGVIEHMSPMWDHENAADLIREQIGPSLRKLGCRAGSGNLDLPGSPNWYVPDLAVVPADLAKGGGALLPDQTLLVVEVTSDSNGDTDRIVKRRRYAEFGAPLYLLVDRQEHACTLFSRPGQLGYTHTDGPLPFGTPVRLPEPFDLDLDTSEF
ncbi:Uma2 family endonuclease [Streptomyces klenkii]